MQIKDFPNKAQISNTDLFLLQDSSDNAYKHCNKEQLLEGIGSSGGSMAPWVLINTNYAAKIGDRLIVNPNKTVTLPSNPSIGDQVDFFAASGVSFTNPVSVDTNSNNFEGFASARPIRLVEKYASASLVYLGSTDGWVGIPQKVWRRAGQLVAGARLILQGSLTDASGNNNNATPVGTVSPAVATGLDNQPVLRWTATSNQELQVAPFMAGTTAATLYIVYTVDSTQYNLIRTASLDDYWRFSSNGNGYFGTFRNSRFSDYPAVMPNTGSHLVSIHINSTSYEVLLNNLSKGVQTGNLYSPGDRFRIVTNDKPFKGDLASLIVYPSFISKDSLDHQSIVSYFKERYPSLSYSI